LCLKVTLNILYEIMKRGKLPQVTRQEIDEALSYWDIPEMPEPVMSNWLYELVKRNVKRGRFFHLRDVLLHRQADCLGYAQLMNCLGQRFGLDSGIVEIVIDNGGRYVPHYVNLIKFSSGKRQFMDLWYGGKDIKHRRIGAHIKEGRKWRVRDLDWDELEDVEDIKGLPPKAIEGIIHYILGNRHLRLALRDKNGAEFDCAIQYYTRAISLYPGYARAHFNRAIAYENKGEHGKATLDYAQSLRDESSQIRVLAREHEDVIGLMELDRANIGIREQEIYLLRKGFITGQQVTLADVARYFGIPEDKVSTILSAIEAKIDGNKMKNYNKPKIRGMNSEYYGVSWYCYCHLPR